VPPVLDAVRRGGASPSPSHPAAERWLQKREATAAQASARQQRREECLRCSTQYGVAAGCKLTISKNGRCIKVGQQTRTNVFWDGVEPPVLDQVNIISVDSDWVRYGQGRNDRFRNVRTAGGFVINATELRSVNFSMQAVDVPLRFTPSRRHGRRAAVLTAPVPKRTRCTKTLIVRLGAVAGDDVCYLDFSLRHCLSNSTQQAYLYF